MFCIVSLFYRFAGTVQSALPNVLYSDSYFHMLQHCAFYMCIVTYETSMYRPLLYSAIQSFTLQYCIALYGTIHYRRLHCGELYDIPNYIRYRGVENYTLSSAVSCTELYTVQNCTLHCTVMRTLYCTLIIAQTDVPSQICTKNYSHYLIYHFSIVSTQSH